MRCRFAAAIFGLILVAACGPSGVSTGPAPSGSQVAPNRILNIVTQVEPSSLSEHRALYTTSGDAADAKRLFNASFYLADIQGVARPLLLDQGPQLNTDSWRVNPDGTMNTIYRLRSNLTWHDGTPFTADDMVLSWQMAKNPDYGVADLKPMNVMSEAVAVDPHTVAMHWKTTYAGADSLSGRDWSPLPSHLLGSAFQTESAQVFLARPYWTTQFVGLGPFKLVDWQPGAFVAGSAFDGYALGRPKIDRIEVRFATDPNTAVVMLLSGAADISVDKTLGFEQGTVLRRQWEINQEGNVLLTANNMRYIQVQFKPEFINPPEIRDVRVRQALFYALDRQALLDGLQGGQGQIAEGFLTPDTDYYDQGVRQITRYPHDPAQAERLLQSAGLVKQGERAYVTADGKRFSFELRSAASDQEAREAAINADLWKQLGADVQTRSLSAEEFKDGEVRSAYPAFFDTDTSGIAEEVIYVKLYGPNAATAATRWQGSNRGGYSSPDFDALYQQLTTSLERSAQVDAVLKSARYISEQALVFPLYYNYGVKARIGALKGPQATAPSGSTTWAVEQWNWAS
ncbi:MAG TPA: ABC transporter substrate-binding protein [Chloroflexota bacterium]